MIYRRLLRRRRRPGRPAEPLPDPGTVFVHGFETTPQWVHDNSQQIMDGFDELPKRIRDRINYARTPEGGARAVDQIVDELIARSRRR